MTAFILSISLLIICLYGYYLAIRQSKLEKELRQKNMDYECFKCKDKLPINTIKCPLITIYGARRKNFWLIIPIAVFWLFMLGKWSKVGMF